MNNVKPRIERIHVSVPVKLSLLWASLLSFYIYNDYLLFFMPGQIEGMNAGSFGPFGEVTDLKLLAVAAFLAIPISMIFLSSILPSSVSRWLNMIIGPIHGISNALTLLPFFTAPLFFKFIVSIEIIVTLLILWTAARWPKQDG
ncbi:DUF6326 family protein [Iodidimonas gelatinilytica]|uniref:DUF6326 family protein n=1 Tax=Iodidimonas gelatinilytica TaxID=1236966 RepID=UPI001230AE39|nr:DUF6326 family protein [Iodidimonas gelatinilytica]